MRATLLVFAAAVLLAAPVRAQDSSQDCDPNTDTNCDAAPPPNPQGGQTTVSTPDTPETSAPKLPPAAADALRGAKSAIDNAGAHNDPTKNPTANPTGARNGGGGGNGATNASNAAKKDTGPHAPDQGCSLAYVTGLHTNYPIPDPLTEESLTKRNFEISKRVAWRYRTYKGGLLLKPGGENIISWQGQSFSALRFCYTHNGHIYKVVQASGLCPTKQDPNAPCPNAPECLDDGYVSPKRCVPAMDPSLP